jgi:hypothetical protein
LNCSVAIENPPRTTRLSIWAEGKALVWAEKQLAHTDASVRWNISIATYLVLVCCEIEVLQSPVSMGRNRKYSVLMVDYPTLLIEDTPYIELVDIMTATIQDAEQMTLVKVPI